MNDVDVAAEAIINTASKYDVSLRQGSYFDGYNCSACAVGVLWIDTRGSYEDAKAVYHTSFDTDNLMGDSWWTTVWSDLTEKGGWSDDYLTGLSSGYECQISIGDSEEYRLGYAVGQRIIELQQEEED